MVSLNLDWFKFFCFSLIELTEFINKIGLNSNVTKNRYSTSIYYEEMVLVRCIYRECMERILNYFSWSIYLGCMKIFWSIYHEEVLF